MKVEDAAKEYCERDFGSYWVPYPNDPTKQSGYLHPERLATDAFLAGAEWQRDNPEWISVKERLPENQGEYLVYSTLDPRLSVKTFEYMGKACFCISRKPTGQLANWKREAKTGFYIESIYTPEVTHWMPLPKPPQELEEK